MLKITFSDGKVYKLDTPNIAYEAAVDIHRLGEAMTHVMSEQESPDAVRSRHIKQYLDMEAQGGFIEVEPRKFYALSAIVSIEVVDAAEEKAREEARLKAITEAEDRQRRAMRAAATLGPRTDGDY